MSEKTDQILASNKLKIHKWKVREGFFVTPGQIVLLYETPDDIGTTGIQKLKSTKAGIVFERLVKEGQSCDKGQPIVSLRECSHTTVIKDLCAECGADLQQNEDGNVNQASVPMIHSVPELKVTEKLAQKLGKADSERLLSDKKLVLLVDLDQTVVHTTNDNVPNNLKDVYHFQLYGPNSPWYHTRLRPGALDFLKKMHEFYELHICTFGARNYAHTIAQFLDENGRLFSQRILSRDECFNATSKTDNLKALFPCGDSMVCIIDDREDVWNCVTNLIQVKPYHFFQHTGDINAPPALAKHELDGKGIDFMKDISSISHIEKLEKACEDVAKENGTDDEEKSELSTTSDSDKIINVVDDVVTDTESLENQSTGEPETNKPEIKPKIAEPADNMIVIEDPDDYLLYLEHILIQIHQRFYDIYEKTAELPDLKSLIPKVKSEVLVGKNLVFSGLVPNNQRLINSRPYLVARSLGANVTQELGATTTHLIAATAGTFKVNNARKRTDILVVTPDWLWTCAERWEACDERLFPLLANKHSHKMRQPPIHCQSPEHMVNYGESSKASASTEDELKFVDTINPLLSFSNADLDDMNKDFDQFFESDDSSSSSDEPVDMENPPMEKALKKRKRAVEKEERQEFFKRAERMGQVEPKAAAKQEKDENKDSSEDEEMPSTKFRRGEIPDGMNPNSDDDTADIDQTYEEEDDDGDDGQWNMMGAALEREFLGLE